MQKALSSMGLKYFNKQLVPLQENEDIGLTEGIGDTFKQGFQNVKQYARDVHTAGQNSSIQQDEDNAEVERKKQEKQAYVQFVSKPIDNIIQMLQNKQG